MVKVACERGVANVRDKYSARAVCEIGLERQLPRVIERAPQSFIIAGGDCREIQSRNYPRIPRSNLQHIAGSNNQLQPVRSFRKDSLGARCVFIRSEMNATCPRLLIMPVSKA